VRGYASSRLIALLAPPRCAGCGAECRPGRWICRGCRDRLSRQAPPIGTGADAAAFAYAGIPQRLVRELKFAGAVALAGEMADLMAERCVEQLADARWIVPAPAHPGRRRERGYNPSRLLARELAVRSGAGVVDCLRRRGGRPPQSQLDRRARLALPGDEIFLDARVLSRAINRLDSAKPTNVVVCDDVATTGVTLEVCVQAIREEEPEAGRLRLRSIAFAAA
jgi:predicted amidophosphoribosyltransferase